MSSSASTFIGGLSIGVVGTLVVQQVASTPAPEPPVVPTPILEVVPLLTLGLLAVAVVSPAGPTVLFELPQEVRQ